jgi:hypothetical protein
MALRAVTAVTLGRRAALRKDSLVDRVDVDSGPEFVVAIALLTLLAVT